MPLWAPLALSAVTAALLAVPVTPALYELWKRGDAAPLPTSRHDGKIANFADVFRSRLEPLHPQLEQCRALRELSRTSIGGTEVLLVGCDSFNFDPRVMQGVAAMMFSQAAVVPASSVVEADVYADGTLDLAEGAMVRAAFGRSDIFLQKNSAFLRWLHADGNVHLQQGSTAYGRLSAGRSIRLEPGCGFQHMHAPQIFTVDADQPDHRSHLLRECEPHSSAHICKTLEDTVLPADVGDAFASSRQRIRVRGNFDLPAGETLNANIIATGELHLGVGARLFGSAKSYKDTILEEDACVHGSIVSGETVRLGPRCFAAGPVMAEGDIVMDRGSRVGEPDALTTISSCGAQIAPGCQLHGTVWARGQGNVKG